MESYLTEVRVHELTKKLPKDSNGSAVADAESVIRLAAAEAVAAYRKWLQNDGGMN